MKEKLKSWLENDQYFYSFLVLFVGVLSFYLGQQSVGVERSAEAAAVYVSSPTTTRSAAGETGISTPVTPILPETSYEVVVASKSGTKYHLPQCPGAQQIKPENRITFSSPAAAQAAGYSPAANCPGLK